nr:MAG TPA: Bromelain inhibitor VI [Caudoviricetes sp.]
MATHRGSSQESFSICPNTCKEVRSKGSFGVGR